MPKSIGEKYQSDGVGMVEIVDVFISPSSLNRVYLVKDGDDNTYYFDGGELYDTPQNNWKVSEVK